MKNRKDVRLVLIAAIVLLLLLVLFIVRYGTAVYAIETPITSSPTDCTTPNTHFAIIGDYGSPGTAVGDVAALVQSWDVAFIVTAGDNNYDDGAAETIDENIGQYYADYIYPYAGQYGPGATENRFWPALGNHDLYTEYGRPYFDYFQLPGNERYYDVRQGDVHFFILNSDPNEPDGRTVDSPQAQWLQTQLAASDASWKLVIMHHPPYTSSLKRNPTPELQWPYADWGATAVIAGHDHFYERLTAQGIPYFVNGSGGRDLDKLGRSEPESVVRYNVDYGAMQVWAGAECLNFSFYNRQNELIDSLTLRR